MNKFHKIITALAIACAAGLTYAVVALKGLPEAFDWEDDDNE
jgi:hypothetical protein